jgi:NAD(P)-dependent dehydrogenase (short-subunit alcohol dehydrogenase family)
MDIKGRVAIVTGAGAGIGRATALALAEAGALGVTLADIDEEGLAETARQVVSAGATALVLRTDVTSIADLERLYAETAKSFERLDIVVNNAGIVSGPPPFPETSLGRIALVIAIDLTAVVQSTALAIRAMGASGGGAVVNVSSAGALNPLPSDATYAAAKAGVLHLGTSCAEFAATCGVRVNSVCPGVTETAILEKTGGGARPDWLEPILSMIDILMPADIAGAILGLIEDDSKAGEYVLVSNPVKGAA